MNLLLISIILTASIPYFIIIYGVFKGKIKQSFATWLMWLVLDLVILLSIKAQGGSALLSWIYSIGTAATLIALIIKKQSGWSTFDSTMALLAGICTLIFMYAEPYYSTIAGTVAINIASVPQVVSTIKKPEHTPPGPYLLFAISALLAIIAAPAWTVGDRLFPVSAFLFCMLIFSLALRRKRKSASEIVDSVFVEIE